jgi:hypothetical protein
MHLVHRLAQTRRRAAPAISIHNGPCLRPRCESGGAGMAVLGLCGCFLPWCAGSVADDGGYELVDCCFCSCGGVECGLLCCLGEEAVCWAGGVCEEAGLGQCSIVDVELESRATKASQSSLEIKLLVVPKGKMFQYVELRGTGSLYHTLTARSYDAWPQ